MISIEARIHVCVRVRPPLEMLREHLAPPVVCCQNETDVIVPASRRSRFGDSCSPSYGQLTASAMFSQQPHNSGATIAANRPASPSHVRRQPSPTTKAATLRPQHSMMYREGGSAALAAGGGSSSRPRSPVPVAGASGGLAHIATAGHHFTARPDASPSAPVRPQISLRSTATPCRVSSPARGISIHAVNPALTSSSALMQEHAFRFDACFDPTATQSEVYEETVMAIVERALRHPGHAGCVLCYGPTGSGKTYTMIGSWDERQGSAVGLLPRAAHHILSLIESGTSPTQRRATSAYHHTCAPAKMTLYAAELYLEELRDLLPEATKGTRAASPTSARPQSPDRMKQPTTSAGSAASILSSVFSGVPRVMTGGFTSSNGQRSLLQVRDHVDVSDLCEQLHGHEIRSLAHLQRCFARISERRVTSGTAMNDRSSRSHALFILQVDFLHSGDTVTCGRFSSSAVAAPPPPSFIIFADLAGSERLKQSQVDGAGVSETQAINKSLSALCSVITALYNRSKHIPFRDSKLTRLLRPCLESGHVIALVHVPPGEQQREETISTLKFADRMRHTSLATTPLTGSADHDHDADEATERVLDASVCSLSTRLSEICGDLRIANAALGFLPRRMSKLPLHVLAERLPSWYEAWQGARHAAEQEQSICASLSHTLVEAASRPFREKIDALRDEVNRSHRLADDIRREMAKLAEVSSAAAAAASATDPCDGDAMESVSSYFIEDQRRLARAQRERAAATKLVAVLKNRLHVATEVIQDMKATARIMKADLLSADGPWQQANAALHHEAELLQRETRNALVLKQTQDDHLALIQAASHLLAEKALRQTAEILCHEAQQIGLGDFIDQSVSAARDAKQQIAKKSPSSHSEATKEKKTLNIFRSYVNDDKEDNCSHNGRRVADDEVIMDASIAPPLVMPRRWAAMSSASSWLPKRGFVLSTGTHVTPRPSLVGLYGHATAREDCAWRSLQLSPIGDVCVLSVEGPLRLRNDTYNNNSCHKDHVSSLQQKIMPTRARFSVAACGGGSRTRGHCIGSDACNPFPEVPTDVVLCLTIYSFCSRMCPSTTSDVADNDSSEHSSPCSMLADDILGDRIQNLTVCVDASTPSRHVLRVAVSAVNNSTSNSVRFETTTASHRSWQLQENAGFTTVLLEFSAAVDLETCVFAFDKYRRSHSEETRASQANLSSSGHVPSLFDRLRYIPHGPLTLRDESKRLAAQQQATSAVSSIPKCKWRSSADDPCRVARQIVLELESAWRGLHNLQQGEGAFRSSRAETRSSDTNSPFADTTQTKQQRWLSRVTVAVPSMSSPHDACIPLARIFQLHTLSSVTSVPALHSGEDVDAPDRDLKRRLSWQRAIRISTPPPATVTSQVATAACEAVHDDYVRSRVTAAVAPPSDDKTSERSDEDDVTIGYQIGALETLRCCCNPRGLNLFALLHLLTTAAGATPPT